MKPRRTPLNSTCITVDNQAFTLFSEWMALAEKSEPNDPNAMCLSTVNAGGEPSSRMVLLKHYDDQGFVFFTNSRSHKGQDLSANPKVALLFHWKSLLRQIRVNGVAEIIPRSDTEVYFHSRARASQIASAASLQSQPLPDRQVFENRMAQLDKDYKDADTIPCPDHWNGYRVTPHRIEFWIQKDFRTHDRTVYTRGDQGQWTTEKLYP